jgi:hypothetical protein
MNNRIEIAIGNKKLVAEVSDWSEEAPKELCIFIVDENGGISQDICTIRECYIYQEKSGEWIRNDKFLDCFGSGFQSIEIRLTLFL